MSFYGKLTEADQPRPLRKFIYRTYPDATPQEIHAHDIYFYEHGRIGFWNDAGDDRVLVLGTKAFDVREVANEPQG